MVHLVLGVCSALDNDPSRERMLGGDADDMFGLHEESLPHQSCSDP
jgi:hypothetical protein